ncbi:uncharacterized protein BXZ73DRAFT_107929 [Epithele typhae]|uniref:uncharacterized protein n=1 Tax=Epithele typhae TaxID=378194 RepID=UPI002007E990|nr:uncharacterized protein BXZ73DRAFT_107929 [Epithele typhae]KAH9911545.1 hypothetical protein BXZ73DRAFT_107929 [Epithele typhae]
MCSYLQRQLKIKPSALKEFDQKVRRDSKGSGPYPSTHTQLAPGAAIPDSATHSLHASSHEDPSPDRHAQHNSAALPRPKVYPKAFVAPSRGSSRP